ncbi:MAG TPA: AmmeMemoRadiSam system protein A [Verrucomicrobiae bacterium]|nr:AmmeMemoRadiSam system protein A [Verrucomicrobiae bacterium]
MLSDRERPPVDLEEQQKLLRWVRATIEAAVRGESPEEVSDTELTGRLRAPHGVFVTLKKQGELRGCIGKMDFERPLWTNALEAAVASALEDPRFPPVDPRELSEIAIEISILNPPEDLPRPELFDPLREGIIVQKGWRHALLLPKVAQEQGWDARRTLETVCWKAGLPADAWRDPAARLQVFTAFDFGEERTE